MELGIGGEQDSLTALGEPAFWGKDGEWVWQWQDGCLQAWEGGLGRQAPSDSSERGWKEEQSHGEDAFQVSVFHASRPEGGPGRL